MGRGVQDPRELAQDVPVVGWRPVNSPFHVSDIPRVISILGGSKLYGNDWRVPLRELLQNAVDAIKARRHLQGSQSLGEISVKLEQRADSYWLTVEDDGVGMSEHVLTHNLVDFGSSLWRSTGVAEEFPGLAARGMKAIGKFGIGFFSAFMIANEVRVVTRRFDQASTDALQLLFNQGVNSRPIVAAVDPATAPRNGGTRVELKLLGPPTKGGNFEFVTAGGKQDDYDPFGSLRVEVLAGSLSHLVKQLAPCADTLIRVSEEGRTEVAVNPNDWVECAATELLDRIITNTPKPLQGSLEVLMRPIISSTGTIIGRAALWPTYSYASQTGVLVADGFRVQPIPHLAGVLIGEVETAARNAGNASIDKQAFREWATEQGAIILEAKLPNDKKAHMAEIILELEGTIGELPIIRRDEEWFGTKALKTLLRKLDKVVVYVGNPDHDEYDEVSATSFENSFELDSKVFVIPTISSSFSVGPTRSSWRRTRPSHIVRKFERILDEVWKKGWDEDEDLTLLGEVHGIEIYRQATTYSRSD